MRQCPNCGARNTKTAQFCVSCGTSLQNQPEMPTCPKCGQPVSAKSRFCEHCGYQLSTTTSQATASQGRSSRKPPKRPVWPKVVTGLVVGLIIAMAAFGWLMYRRTQINTQNEQRVAQEQSSKAQQASAERLKAAKASSAAERQSNSRATSSRQESLAESASSSAAAESSKQAASSRKADSDSVSAASSESAATMAKSLRRMLVDDFDCDQAAVAAIPDKVLADMLLASSKAGEDIGGFYNRVKARYPKIGGNILGPDATSSDQNVDADSGS